LNFGFEFKYLFPSPIKHTMTQGLPSNGSLCKGSRGRSHMPLLAASGGLASKGGPADEASMSTEHIQQ